jgi:hypothetical protein
MRFTALRLPVQCGWRPRRPAGPSRSRPAHTGSVGAGAEDSTTDTEQPQAGRAELHRDDDGDRPRRDAQGPEGGKVLLFETEDLRRRRGTKFSPERSSTSVASKLVERETLNEPSLEKATSDYRATWGTSTDLRAGQTALASTRAASSVGEPARTAAAPNTGSLTRQTPYPPSLRQPEVARLRHDPLPTTTL